METPSFGQRFALAFSAFFKILFNGRFAAGVLAVGRHDSGAEPVAVDQMANDTMPHQTTTHQEQDTVPAQPLIPEPKTEPMPNPAGLDRKALQFIGALQREGRFIDFLMEDLSAAADQDIGAAARHVHAGCKSVLTRYLTIEPVWPQEEGSTVTVDDGFDRDKITLTGNVTGQLPLDGRLEHAGWYAQEVNLPELSEQMDPAVLMPAEIDV